jgi:hypothetical protein
MPGKANKATLAKSSEATPRSRRPGVNEAMKSKAAGDREVLRRWLAADYTKTQQMLLLLQQQH